MAAVALMEPSTGKTRCLLLSARLCSVGMARTDAQHGAALGGHLSKTP